MDMTDLNRAPISAAQAPENATPVEADHWREVVAGMSAEIAGPLTAALDRVQVLATTGRIDRTGLRALSEEIERARQISISGQQMARLASGKLRQTHERLALTETLKDVLTQRARETRDRNIHIKQVLKPAEVVVDASMLFSLLNGVLSWSLEHACANIEFRIDIKTWPRHARVLSKFALRPADQLDDGTEDAVLEAKLDTMSWLLMQQTAATMGLNIDRKVKKGEVQLAVEFPRTISDEIEGVTAIELEHGFGNSMNTKPLAGSQVLVVASRRDMRVQIRDALRNMGLIVDFVNSVEEGREFCRGGLPHAIIIESVLRGARFNELRADAESGPGEVVFIEIIEEGNTFEISGFGGLSMARVGRDAILSSLPSALMFELAKVH